MAARVVQEQDQVTIITSNGIALRTTVAAISQMSRMTRGVRIVNPDRAIRSPLWRGWLHRWRWTRRTERSRKDETGIVRARHADEAE